MGPRAWTRGWTTTRRACGARTLSRASRRPWPSTHPAAAARSSCRTRARCTVRAAGRPSLPCPLPNQFHDVQVARASLGVQDWVRALHKQAERPAPLAPPAWPGPGGFGVTQWAQETGSVWYTAGPAPEGLCPLRLWEGCPAVHCPQRNGLQGRAGGHAGRACFRGTSKGCGDLIFCPLDPSPAPLFPSALCHLALHKRQSPLVQCREGAPELHRGIPQPLCTWLLPAPPLGLHDSPWPCLVARPW